MGGELEHRGAREAFNAARPTKKLMGRALRAEDAPQETGDRVELVELVELVVSRRERFVMGNGDSHTPA